MAAEALAPLHDRKLPLANCGQRPYTLSCTHTSHVVLSYHEAAFRKSLICQGLLVISGIEITQKGFFGQGCPVFGITAAILARQ